MGEKMSQEYYDIKARDPFSNDVTFCCKGIPEDEAMVLLDEHRLKKMGRSKRCPLMLHNFPNTKPKTKCKDCGISVEQFRKERKREISIEKAKKSGSEDQ